MLRLLDAVVDIKEKTRKSLFSVIEEGLGEKMKGIKGQWEQKITG